MTSVVDICNYALAKVGEQTIVSLGDGTPPSNYCDLLYGKSRDFILRAHPWNCAIKRKALAASTTEPVYDYDNRFPLPSDLLRLLDVDLENYTSGWRVENRAVLADTTGPLNIRYIYRIQDPNEFDSHVVELIAAHLAVELAEPLTQSNTKKQILMQEFKDTFTIARRSDAQEDSPTRRESGSWLRSRI